MGIITKMRRQDAIYWPPGTAGAYGAPTHGALVELVRTADGNYQVRWEDKSDEFIAADGTTTTSSAVVYVPPLPGGGEVALGGYLWLGARADLADEADPKANPGAHEVRRVDMLPNLRATETLRTAYL